jgi:L-rhamnose mutarotase
LLIIKYLINNINLEGKQHFQTILESINNNNSRDITLFLIKSYNNLFINKYKRKTVEHMNELQSDIKCELYNEYNQKVHKFLFENFKFSQEEFTKIL